MEILLTEQTAPPSWSAAFNEYFATLKAWLMGSAYPALSNGPLKMEGAVTSIPTEVASIEGEIRLHRPIPVALVGRTGVGKSTLLNALLEEENSCRLALSARKRQRSLRFCTRRSGR